MQVTKALRKLEKLRLMFTKPQRSYDRTQNNHLDTDASVRDEH